MLNFCDVHTAHALDGFLEERYTRSLDFAFGLPDADSMEKLEKLADDHMSFDMDILLEKLAAGLLSVDMDILQEELADGHVSDDSLEVVCAVVSNLRMKLAVGHVGVDVMNIQVAGLEHVDGADTLQERPAFGFVGIDRVGNLRGKFVADLVCADSMGIPLMLFVVGLLDRMSRQ